MREIIQIGLGQCGTKVSQKYWEKVRAEYSGDKVDTSKILNFFRESEGDLWPRAILADTDMENLDLKSGGSVFSPENVLVGQGSCGKNWCNGFYSEGHEIIGLVLESVRKECERSQNPQGFQICISLGGGTGSGTGTLLVNRLKEEYFDKVVQVFAVFPSEKIEDIVIEPYNAVLALKQLTENADNIAVFDNEAVYDMCKESGSAEYTDINDILADCMCAFNWNLRFPGKYQENMQRFMWNLIPFPDLPYLSSSYSDFNLKNFGDPQRNCCFTEVFSKLFSEKCTVSSGSLKNGRFLTALTIFQGDSERQSEINEYAEFQQKKNFDFLVPNWLKSDFCKSSSKKTRNQGVLIGNNTCVVKVMQRVLSKFKRMIRTKAFTAYYTGQGLDYSEFEESQESLTNVINTYQEYGNYKDN